MNVNEISDGRVSETIYMDGDNVPLDKALEEMTDRWIEGGNYCDQTVMDLRHALIRERNRRAGEDDLLERVAKRIDLNYDSHDTASIIETIRSFKGGG